MKRFFSLIAISLLFTSAWAANTYVKVTSIDQLEAGVNYILVNEEASRAMGEITGTSTNYGSAVNVTIDNGVIDIDGTDVIELFSGQGSDDVLGHHTWTFNIGEGSHYMCWASGNSLNTVNSSAPNNAMWIATLTDDGVVLTNKADNSRKLQYNSSAPRFACYTSNQKPAVLYKQGVPEDEGINTLSKANALNDDEEFTFVGDAVVTVFQNGYMFLRDESGYGMITNVTGEFENGQVLTQGWNATKTSENGWVRYINAAGLIASGETNAELAAAQELNSVPDESMINAYVVYKNVTWSMFQRKITLADGTTTVSVYDMFGLNYPGGFGPDSRHWNFYGIIGKQGDRVVLYPTDFMQYTEPEPQSLRGDVNKSGDVTIADVTALIDYLLGVVDEPDVDPVAANCNLDDKVSIADVTALIDYLLNKTWD